MQAQRRRIDPEVESDRPGYHHEQQETLARQRRNARPDQRADKQAAGGAGHRKPKALQKMS